MLMAYSLASLLFIQLSANFNFSFPGGGDRSLADKIKKIKSAIARYIYTL
jgi:hypothetical protein